MSVRYVHRHHGTVVCGGEADPWQEDSDRLAITIITPPTWTFTEESVEEWRHFYDDWTLDIWFHGTWFATISVEDCYDENIFYYPESVDVGLETKRSRDCLCGRETEWMGS